MNIPEPKSDFRPWGQEVWLTRDGVEPAMVKAITVKPGEALSLQYHHNRDEFWYVVSGNGRAEIDGATKELSAGISCFVPRETRHRIYGGTIPLIFVECAYGTFDESDIVRLDDKYGRT